MPDLITKLKVFEEFLDCNGIALWHYDGEMRLISSSHPNSDALHAVLSIGDSKSKIQDYCLHNRYPAFGADISSLLWIAAPYHVNGVLTDIYLFLLIPFPRRTRWSWNRRSA